MEELGCGSLIGQFKLIEQLDAPQNLFVSLARNMGQRKEKFLLVTCLRGTLECFMPMLLLFKELARLNEGDDDSFQGLVWMEMEP